MLEITLQNHAVIPHYGLVIDKFFVMRAEYFVSSAPSATDLGGSTKIKYIPINNDDIRLRIQSFLDSFGLLYFIIFQYLFYHFQFLSWKAAKNHEESFVDSYFANSIIKTFEISFSTFYFSPFFSSFAKLSSAAVPSTLPQVPWTLTKLAFN